MKPTLKILKNNIFTILVLAVFIIFMFCLSYFKKIYWDNNNTASYGDRIEDNINHIIAEDEKNEALENIKKIDNVVDVKYDLAGRTINLIITVKDDLSKSKAKKVAEEALKKFTEDQQSYYAFQFYLVKEDTSKNDFPIIGYKHYSSDSISWTKNREVTSNENK